MRSQRKHRLAPKTVFYRRLRANAAFGSCIMAVSLGIGILGYKYSVPEFSWFDSLLNAAMILSGMGPVIDANIQLTNGAKVFASVYALFSGVAFISTIGILIAPIAHRFFHKLHLQDQDLDDEPS